jgi:hypothetical protein
MSCIINNLFKCASRTSTNNRRIGKQKKIQVNQSIFNITLFINLNNPIKNVEDESSYSRNYNRNNDFSVLAATVADSSSRKNIINKASDLEKGFLFRNYENNAFHTELVVNQKTHLQIKKKHIRIGDKMASEKSETEIKSGSFIETKRITVEPIYYTPSLEFLDKSVDFPSNFRFGISPLDLQPRPNDEKEHMKQSKEATQSTAIIDFEAKSQPPASRISSEIARFEMELKKGSRSKEILALRQPKNSDNKQLESSGNVNASTHSIETIDLCNENIQIPKNKIFSQNEVLFDDETFFEGYSRVLRGNLRTEDANIEVAVKMIRDCANRDERDELRLHLLREVDLIKQLRHKNIVRFIGVIKVIEEVYAVMTEWLPGCDLFEFYVDHFKFKRYYLQTTIYDICDIMSQIANGLVYIHGRNVLHNDLKSDLNKFLKINFFRSI